MKPFSPAWLLAVALPSLLATSCATSGTAGRRDESRGALEIHLGRSDVVTHQVLKGQTLYRIAKTYDVSVDELMDANRIDDPRELKIGELLYVPGARLRRDVTPYDSPEPEAQGRAGLASSRAPDRKQLKAPVGRGNGSLNWPLRGVLYARFGKKGKEPHDGIDLAAPAGLPVKTAAPGTVLFAGDQKGYGLIVIVEHDAGLITLYAHNRDLRVKTGQKVRDGQVVATVGDSGRTSGPHLHFEVRKDGQPVDPLEFLGAVPPAST